MTYQTSIRLTSDTKDRLSALGSKGDSYDDIINGLIDYYIQAEKKDKNIPKYFQEGNK